MYKQKRNHFDGHAHTHTNLKIFNFLFLPILPFYQVRLLYFTKLAWYNAKRPRTTKRETQCPSLIHKNDHVIPNPFFVEREKTESPIHPSILQTEYTSTGIRLYVQEREKEKSVRRQNSNEQVV